MTLTSEDFYNVNQVNKDGNYIYLDYCGKHLSVNRKFDLETRIVELLTLMLMTKGDKDCFINAKVVFKQLEYIYFCLLVGKVK